MSNSSAGNTVEGRPDKKQSKQKRGDALKSAEKRKSNKNDRPDKKTTIGSKSAKKPKKKTKRKSNKKASKTSKSVESAPSETLQSVAVKQKRDTADQPPNSKKKKKSKSSKKSARKRSSSTEKKKKGSKKKLPKAAPTDDMKNVPSETPDDMKNVPSETPDERLEAEMRAKLVVLQEASTAKANVPVVASAQPASTIVKVDSPTTPINKVSAIGKPFSSVASSATSATASSSSATSSTTSERPTIESRAGVVHLAAHFTGGSSRGRWLHLLDVVKKTIGTDGCAADCQRLEAPSIVRDPAKMTASVRQVFNGCTVEWTLMESALEHLRASGVLCKRDTRYIRNAMRCYQLKEGALATVSYHQLALVVSEYAKPIAGKPMSFQRR